MSEQNIPAAVEELDWQTKCDRTHQVIGNLKRMMQMLNATPLDFKPDDADCSDTKITLDKQVK